MELKTYIVAARGDREDSVAPDWVEQLRGMAGIEVKGGTRDQAVITADQQAIDRLRGTFGRDFLIEEEAARHF